MLGFYDMDFYEFRIVFCTRQPTWSAIDSSKKRFLLLLYFYPSCSSCLWVFFTLRKHLAPINTLQPKSSRLQFKNNFFFVLTSNEQKGTEKKTQLLIILQLLKPLTEKKTFSYFYAFSRKMSKKNNMFSFWNGISFKIYDNDKFFYLHFIFDSKKFLAKNVFRNDVVWILSFNDAFTIFHFPATSFMQRFMLSAAFKRKPLTLKKTFFSCKSFPFSRKK